MAYGKYMYMYIEKQTKKKMSSNTIGTRSNMFISKMVREPTNSPSEL